MFCKLKHYLLAKIRYYVLQSLPEAYLLCEIKEKKLNFDSISEYILESCVSDKVKIQIPTHITFSKIGDYSYLCKNAHVSRTTIGKYCSIGPNLMCGWGIHPTNGISTSPIFYSTRKQVGKTFCKEDKIVERKPILVGNDVFIGANVTILDGVEIGDGAVIGAGAVVSKDIPPYAIAVGCPIRIVGYRFDNDKIESLLRIQWWNFNEEQLIDVEKLFFDIDSFITKYDNKKI